MSSTPTLQFHAESRGGVTVDLKRLVQGRALVTGNSGAGKSTLLRYMLEQTHGQIQQIVLDPEGEFASLRGAFPYLLAGGRDADVLVAAADGAELHLGNFEPLPVGDALRLYWLDRLPEGEAAVLRVLIEQHPQWVTRDEISEATGYKRSTRDAYIQRLKARQLIQVAGDVKVADFLFDGG